MAAPRWVAIDSSTDRREWAAALARAHERGLAGATAQPEVREVIDQSWRRSARAHVDPIGGIAPLVMSEEEAETVGAAYRTYRKLQHKLRLDGMEKARVEPALVATEREAVLALWERVFG